MYNQALILMRCVVAAEEYNMARHALLPIPAPSQDARNSGDALAGPSDRSQGHADHRGRADRDSAS